MRSSGKTWNTRSGLRCDLYGMSYELVLPELQDLRLAFRFATSVGQDDDG
jgi:hypothetical protein